MEESTTATSTAAENILSQAFEEDRPCVLFLGQDSWATDDEVDPVLSIFIERLGRAHLAHRGWRSVLASPIADSDLEWLSERFERSVIAESIQEALDLAWSAVFTSSIDQRLSKRIESIGRQPETIAAADHFPNLARSRSRPPVHFLFGRACETSHNARAPRSEAELARRETRHVALLLSRLPDTVTSFGILVIDGYNPERDWLRLDALLGTLPVGEGMRVLWCGLSEPDSPLFRELRDSGTLVIEPLRLPVMVSQLKARGRLAPNRVAFRSERGSISLANDLFVDVSPALRLRVEASAAIVDDEWTQPLARLDMAAKAEAFRRFHGDLGGPRLLVEGIARGFAIERPFEGQLQERVGGLVDRRPDLDRVVVLHGQSGTGKSVALARLAHRFRSMSRVPVLLANGRVPEATDVDAFCTETERSGAPTTLVLCDANIPPGRYLALARALSSRGRRVTVVGTSYRLEGGNSDSSVSFIEAPSAVTEFERNALRALMLEFAFEAPSALLSPEEAGNVFGLLYRTISSTRSRLIAGVTDEARTVEGVLRRRSRRVSTKRFASQLADQLVAAGLHGGAMPLFEADADSTFGNDAPGRLIDYVVACGRLDVYVPVNLLMRVLRSHDAKLDIEQIAELFRDLDLFRWKVGADESELLIGPRLRLEAELIARRRLADKRRELQCLIELIEGVRASSVDQSSEMHFLGDLLQKLDRGGPRQAAYVDGYLRVAQALTKLRVDHGVEDARVMLQESSFRRAWLRESSDANDPLLANREEILDEARHVVEEAIQKIQTGRLSAARRTRQNLHVERASIYGFLAVGHAAAGDPAEIVWSDYVAARTATRRAMAVAPTYFPYDIALWTPLDLLDSSAQLTQAQHAELVADLYGVLDQIDISQLSPSDKEKFQRRRRSSGDILEDHALSADARRELESINPAVAVFLDARAMCSEVFARRVEPTLPSSARGDARRTAEFLRERKSKFVSDTRCLRLQLEVEWSAATGDRLLRGERRPLPYDPHQRAGLSSIVGELLAAAGDAAEFSLRYLEAVFTWLSGDAHSATETWRALGHETDLEDSRRVYRRLFVADAAGKPVPHRGRLVRMRSEGHWLVDLENVSGRVELLERDFRGQALKQGHEVREFAIAFNYLGPIADPLTRYEVRQ